METNNAFSVENGENEVHIFHQLSCKWLTVTTFQVTCGGELAVLFVETLVKGKVPYDDNSLGGFL